jgi:small subunit ribosomal protein S2
MADITLAQLLEAGVHFGHKANRWNPKMFPFIYSERDGIHILDLVQTSQLLNEASQFVNTAAQKEKIFLFVGTKRQAAPIIEQEAKNCNSYYVNHRWLGGMLTNWTTVSTRIERFKKA